METLFLACFVFGALFTVLSVMLGSVSHLPGVDVAHFGHVPHAPHAPHALHAPDGQHLAVGQHGDVDLASGGHGLGWLNALPLLNVSSALAFLTWFGAAGYLTIHFGEWGLVAALVAAVLAGLAAAALIAAFLRKLVAGSRALDPRDFRLVGTLARVTVTIPAGGVGEIVFSKAERRRSEAARGVDGQAVPRNTEVVIMDYARGVATVEPWNALLEERDNRLVEQQLRTGALPATPPAAEEAGTK